MRSGILFLLIHLSLSALGQQEVFQGIVVDSATLSPLPYANIQLKGTFRGTSTDAQGNFAITATRKDTLLFTLVGYEPVAVPLWDWEPSIIRMSEKRILLETVTIKAKALDPYGNMFDEQNARIAARKIPFYLPRAKKEKRKLVWLREDNLQAKTYITVVITNPTTKANLMTKHGLSEEAYYNILADFNQKNYTVMYYLTAGELTTLLNKFFERNAVVK